MPDATCPAECNECETVDGDARLHVHQCEVIIRVHSDVSGSGHAETFRYHRDVLWWNCECEK